MGFGELWQALLHGLGSALAFFYDLIPNYGVAIILLTVAVKVVTLPLSIKQTRNMQAMQKLAPEAARIKAKYKGDRQKQMEETTKLYQEHGFNPLGGCLPTIVQMPVLFALFRLFQQCGVALRGKQACPTNQIGVGYLPASSALSKAITTGHAGFLGMHLGLSPLGAYRDLNLLASIPYFLLVGVMALASWYQQKQMTAQQTTEQAPQAQMMGRIMVLMFPLISLNLPIALTLYWAVNALLAIVQQHVMYHGIGSWASRLPLPRAFRSEDDSDAKSKRAEVEMRPTSNSSPDGRVNGPASGKYKGSGARKGRKRR